MSPHLLFWIPAGLRLFFILLGGGILWYFFGPLIGLAGALIGVCIALIVQLRYLSQLSDWLDNPGAVKLPDGWGAWTDIFARLYKLRRDDEKNRRCKF